MSNFNLAFYLNQASDGWPVFVMPYLNAIHASAITCLTQVSDVTPGIFERIAEVGKHDLGGKISSRDWPINGGALSDEGQKIEAGRDVLLTGHEDGSVKLWSCSGVALAPLAVVRTNKFFAGDELDEPRGDQSFLLVLRVQSRVLPTGLPRTVSLFLKPCCREGR